VKISVSRIYFVSFILCAAVFAMQSARASDDGLALTPPMGWNSWNKFGCNVSEQLIRDAADAMVSGGMRDAGYQYVVIDDCWQVSRDENGNILPDPQRFPSGMKALADYVHGKKLKFGLYSDAGTKTCAGRPGSRGYEFQDARQYAAWGVDYLKYDNCNAMDATMEQDYTAMGNALKATGRPIVYSLCEYGEAHVEKWGPSAGANLWRTTGDIRDEWDSMANRNGFSQNDLAPYAGPGHWNDPDMLEIGNGKMTDEEYRTHMSLWSLLASPLLAGNDLRTMTQATRDVLMNTEVIAIDQDPLGRQATRLVQQGSEDIWTRPLADGAVAVGVFNRGEAAMTVTLNASDLKLAGAPLSARDLWAHKDVTFDKGAYSTTIPSHGVFLLRIRGAR